jgi:hypothetical protein
LSFYPVVKHLKHSKRALILNSVKYTPSFV